ncbi:MAG: hypothetical protein HUU50_09915 [Candidatus Brocadiae bacterium]|nr:hypothetical protein [Candidatus Brocadiia bacterium]
MPLSTLNEENNDEFILYSPQEEYKNYVQKKIDLYLSYKEESKLELYRKALEVGLEVLKKFQ